MPALSKCIETFLILKPKCEDINMTLKEKVLQTFIVTIREINKHGGPEVFFNKYPVGGMYYSYSPETEGTVETGTGTNLARLEECKRASKRPLLICADGAKVKDQKVGIQTTTIASLQTEDAAYTYGKILGMQMNDNGIDWLLGPGVDLLLDDFLPLFGWCDDAALTAKIGAAIVRGIQDQGVCATIKHFPGNGTSSVNMHCGIGRNTMSYEEWMNTFGEIYRSGIREDVCSVMTTHTTLESYDKELHEGYYPIATYSKKLTEGLLKKELGFQGVVVTDALIMGGMATGNLVEECAMAFKAGADMLLWPPVETADRIVEMIEAGEIPMSRLEDALERIDRMRAFRKKAVQEQRGDAADAAYIDCTYMQMKRDAMCLTRNVRNILPLSESMKRFLIVDVTEQGKNSSYLLKAELEKRGYQADVVRDIYDVPSNVCWQDDLDKLAADYDMTIFNLDMTYETKWSQPTMLIWASHMFDKNKKVIINYSTPFYVPTYFPEDPTIVEVNSAADEQVVSALVDKLFGKEAFTGKKRLTREWNQVKVFGNI